MESPPHTRFIVSPQCVPCPSCLRTLLSHEIFNHGNHLPSLPYLPLLPCVLQCYILKCYDPLSVQNIPPTEILAPLSQLPTFLFPPLSTQCLPGRGTIPHGVPLTSSENQTNPGEISHQVSSWSTAGQAVGHAWLLSWIVTG